MKTTIQDHLREELLALIAEPVEEARRRESSEFDRRVGKHANRLLLFGAGNLGRRTLSILRKSGQDPVGFIDNNPALWGRRVDGLEVFRPADAANRFGSGQAAVLVSIWYGEATDRMSDRIDPLRALGFSDIALFGHLAWKYPDTFLPHYSLDLPSRLLHQTERVLRAFDLFEDQRSREIFVSHIRWRLHLDYDALPIAVKDTIYFNSRLVRPSTDEFLIDGGAFTGDTVQSFLQTFGRNGFRKILSFEPDPTNFQKLEQYLSALPADIRSKISAMASALGDDTALINVENSGSPSSRVGHGDHQVPCRVIDEFIEGKSVPSFVKLDIEGYEPQALRGAQQTLTRGRPVVAVCVYHVQNHLWEIPLKLAENLSDYRYYLGPHVSDGWDLVLYAVPVERVPTHP
jgi:FkbM family methyltransferase